MSNPLLHSTVWIDESGMSRSTNGAFMRRRPSDTDAWAPLNDSMGTKIRTRETTRMTQNSHIGIAEAMIRATSSRMRSVDAATAAQNFELSFMPPVSGWVISPFRPHPLSGAHGRKTSRPCHPRRRQMGGRPHAVPYGHEQGIIEWEWRRGRDSNSRGLLQRFSRPPPYRAWLPRLRIPQLLTL